MVTQRPNRGRRLAALALAAVLLALVLQPSSAAAAAISTTAQFISGNISVLNVINLDLGSINQGKSWTTGGPTASSSLVNANVGIVGSSILSLGAVSELAGPASGGGKAEAKTTGISILGSNGITTGPLTAACQMTNQDITSTAEIANLRLGGQPTVVVAGQTGVSVPGIATINTETRTATYANNVLTYTVKALDVTLLNGALGLVANSALTVAKASCAGTVALGTTTVSGTTLAPGESGTPTVTVTNTGDVAAINTTITIPLPANAAQYSVGTPTMTTGGGTCTKNTTAVVCTGVTVPGNGSAVVSLPVTLVSSAGTGAQPWAPTGISAVSVPAPQSPNTKIEAPTGAGTLVTAKPPVTTGGTVTVAPATLVAGSTGTGSVSVTNQGPSDASGTVTIPLGNAPPGGVTVVSAKVAGGNDCVIDPNVSITCSGVPIAAKGSARIDIRMSSAVSTTPNSTWDLSGISADLNGKTVTGSGRLLTVSAPTVNLNGGVTIRPATATPGGAQVTPTVRVTNAGTADVSPTTIIIPGLPSGYTLGTVTTDGGGTCALSSGDVVCTGVIVPGGARTVIVSIPVTAGTGATTGWIVSGTPVTATGGGTTGSATGALVTLAPRYTLSVNAEAPADGSASPGGSTTMKVDVANQGPSNATAAPFVVVAPQNTTFGVPSGATASACTRSTLTTLQCSVTLAAGAAASLTLPLDVSLLANPSTPIAGGCVSLDNDSACGGATDSALPSFGLRTPLATRLATVLVPASITPGGTGTGKIQLASTQAETGLTVTLPLTGKPADLTVGTVTGPAGSTCAPSANAITCTGVNLTANTPATVNVPITAASGAAALQIWTPTVTVAAGSDQTSVTAALGGTRIGSYTLGATVAQPANGAVEPGGTVNVQAQVTNNGQSDATPATFRLIAPTGTTFGTLPNICTGAGLAVASCSQNLVNGATTGQLTIPLVTSSGADPDTPVSGGCIDLDGIPGCTTTDPAIPTFTLKVPFASRSVVTADAATVTPGSQATATVHVKAAHGPLSNVTVTIPTTGLTGGLTVDSTVSGPAGSSCTAGANAIVCDHVSVANGATGDIGLTVRAPAGATAGAWPATVAVSATGETPTSTSLQLAAVGVAKPELVTTAVTLGSSSLLPGGTTTLNVALKNQGPSDATGATFNVLAPVGATFGTPPGGSNCTAGLLNTKLTCTVSLAALASANYALPLNVSSIALPGQALVGGCVDLDANGLCTAADSSIPTINVGIPAQQRIVVAAIPATVTPGGAPGSTKISLISSKVETGLTVTVPLSGTPTGLNVDPTQATVPGGTCAADGNGDLRCTGVDLPTPGTPVVITVPLTADASATAAVWTATGIKADDGTGAGGVATDTAILAVVGPAQTSLIATVNIPGAGTTAAGGTGNVDVVIHNGGPSDATGATVTVSAPAGTTLDTLTGQAATDCSLTFTTLATCHVTVAAGQDENYTFPVAVPLDADVFATLNGGCVDLDGAPGCTGSQDKTVGGITLAASIGQRLAISTNPATVTPGAAGGADATVRITATHGALSNINVDVPLGVLPNGMHVASVATSSGSCDQISATDVTCHGLAIAAGASEQLTLHLTADAGLAPTTSWTANGIRADQGGGTPVTVNRLIATAGGRQFVLDPTFGAASTVDPGGTSTYTVTVHNNGPSDSGATTFGFIAPAGATFDATPQPAGCTTASPFTTMSCSVANVTGGGNWGPQTLKLKVKADAAPGQPVAGGCFDGDNNGACTTTAAPPDEKLPDITVSVPFDKQVTVQANPYVGIGAGTAEVLITASGATQSNLTVTIPLPSDAMIVPGALTLDDAGSCATVGSNIQCTGVGVSANQSGSNYVTTISIPVTVDANATSSTVWNAGIRVQDQSSATVTAGAIIARGAAPSYTLHAQATSPADNTVLSGGSTSIAVSITATGAATDEPVIVRAPVNTTFDTITDATTAAACTLISTVTASCTVTVSGGTVSWAFPIVVSSTASTSTPVTGGCVDLNANGSCGDSGTDVAIPGFVLKSALSAVLSATATDVTVVPGGTATQTATVAFGTTSNRTGLVVSFDTAGAPSGLTVGAVDIAGAACPITGTAVLCPAVSLTTGAGKTLSVQLTAAAASSPGATWTPTVTVTEGSDTAVVRNKLATVGAADTELVVDVDSPLDGSVLPGATGYLAVTMTNNGKSALPHARAEFRAPDGTTFAALDAPASDYCTLISDRLVSCDADLGTGSKSFTLGLTVGSTVTGGTSVSGGCADVNLNGACGDTQDVTFNLFVLAKVFGDQAQLTVETGTVVPGQTGTGYLKITSDRTLSGMTLTIGSADMPRPELTLTDVKDVSGTGTCTFTGSITCTGLGATAGTARLISFTAQADPSLPAAATWTPAAITLTSNAGGTSQTTGAVIRTLAPSSGVAYTMTAPAGTLEPGDVADIALKVTNTGPSDATGVVTRVRAPAGTTFATLTAPTSTYCAAVDTARTQLDCRFNLAAGAAPLDWTLPVQIPSNANPNSTISGGCLDLDRDGDCDSSDKPIPDVQLTPTLDQAISVTASDPAIRPGTTGRAVVRILATQAQSGLTVTIPFGTLPAGMTVTAATSSYGNCTPNAGDVTCTTFGVATGGTSTIVLTVAVRDSASPAATWSPAIAIVNTASEAITRTVEVAKVGAADVAVTVTAKPPADGTLNPGDTGQIQVTAVNTGTSAASGLSYSFVAPTGTTFLAPTGTTASFCSLATSTRVTCTLAVAGGGRTTFALPLKVSATADPDNPVTGGCVDTDGNGACTGTDSAITSFRLIAPLSGRITIAGSLSSVTPGAAGTGSVRITSLSAVATATVTIPITGLPTGFLATGATGPTGSACSVTTTQFRCTSVALAAGATTTIAIATTVAANVAPAVVWTATGITVASGTETVSGNADLIQSGARIAKVGFTVTGPAAKVAPGAVTTLTVSGVNAGPSYAVNSTATINAPSNATFGTLTGATATACRAVTTTQLSCTYSLETGNTLTWTLPLKVSSTAKTGDKVAGGCVSADGDTKCGGSQDVGTGSTPVAEPLATHGTLTVGGTIIAAGASGTATITLSATADYDDLLLTLPLDDLPDGFTVTAATLGSDSCTISSATVVCTGVALVSGTARNLRLSVTVDSSAGSTSVWRAAGVTLAPADDETDVLTASGILVSTSATAYTVSVTVAAVSNATPAPGETTVLPITVTNNGPGDADPYPVTIMIPDGASHGTLPSECAEGSSDRIVVCQVSLPAGDSSTIRLPLIIDEGLDPGTVINGGCVDQALSTGTPVFDYTCGGTNDVAIPKFTIGKYDVELAVTYGGGAVPVSGSTRPVVKIPYTNDGTVMADNVSFTVEPPTGVVIAKAEILLDDSTAQQVAQASKLKIKKITAMASTVVATCTKATGGDVNDVVCAAPDAAADTGSELWLTLALGTGVTAGTHAMQVTITTTSKDGVSENNTVSVPLVLTAQDSDSDGDLPTTGADVARLGLLSAILVAFGLVLLIGVRERGGMLAGHRAGTEIRRHAYRRPRHARPSALWRAFRREDGDRR
ncbi:hypothetical protein [Actinoplanes sp. NPDC026619]|uniref:beta strand repeat-containing protein n=1 Tax=Actinoplanes sp. NPDC026619 TaxID=3155798 RepID=UPI0033E819AE